MFLTRNGVEYDLKKSPYIINIDGLEFRFSSAYNMNKFIARKEENPYYSYIEKFFNKNGIYAKPTKLSLMFLYAKIEKRGFYIKENDVLLECLNL